MAAPLGFKTFTVGEVLSAADVNGYLMQGVLVFATTAARDAAITSPQEGQFAFTKDTNSLFYYDGAAWVASGATGDIEGVTAGTGISGGGTSGTVTVTNSMATAIDAKGDLIVGTGADAFSRLAVGANDLRVVAASGETTGLKYVADTQNTVIDSAGDLLYGTAADTVGRLAIGTAGQVLKVNSGATAPEWGTAAAGGGMTQLQALSLSGASVTSSAFSSAYKQIFIYIKSCYGSARDNMQMRLNADTGSNYAYHGVEIGSTLSAYRSSAASFLHIGTVADQSAVKKSSNFGVYIMNPADTDNVFINSQMIWGDATLMYQERMTGIYDSSAAITSITLFPASGTFTSGTAYIYGVN